MTTALEIKNLHVSIGDLPILKGVDLLSGRVKFTP